MGSNSVPHKHTGNANSRSLNWLYFPLVDHILTCRGIIVIKGKSRDRGLHFEGLQQILAHPDIRRNSVRICNVVQSALPDNPSRSNWDYVHIFATQRTGLH